MLGKSPLALTLALSAWVGGIQAAPDSQLPTGAPLRVETGQDVKHDTSIPLRDILTKLGDTQPVTEPAIPRVNFALSYDDLVGNLRNPPADYVSSRVQVELRGGTPAPAIGFAFNGLSGSESGGALPPDTTGDVSPTHYFEWVNSRWMLFDKTTGARLLTSPANGNSFFVGFGGLCETTNRGDPLVLWDDSAQRWVVSQFAFTSTTTPGTFLQCMAVSATSDPLGAYHRYAFTFPLFNDYGKMAIWRTADNAQNAYVLTMHEFTAANPNVFQGTSFSAVERDRMLQGLSAKFIRVGGVPFFGALPIHLEGTNPMPAGSCPQFVDRARSGNGYLLWDFCINWNTGLTTFTDNPTFVASDPFFQDTVGAPQAGATQRLDAFSGRTMYMATARVYDGNGPAEATAVINHAVNVGNNRSGIRWVQFGLLPTNESVSTPNSETFSNGFESNFVVAKRIIDQGVYAPGTDYRWMGSINQDKNGNIGLGYTATGYGATSPGASTINPQVRHTARARTDAPGVLRDEINTGLGGVDCSPVTTGSQSSTSLRWGDYSMTSIDPVDDCTFWHANEYYSTSSAANWNTRICTFRLAECGQADFVLETSPGSRLSFCANPARNPTVNVRVGALGSLAGNTTISTSGFPGGVSANLGSTTLAPGASTTLTLAGASALAPGVYSGTVSAVNGLLSRNRTVSFGVSAANAVAPTTNTPANGTLGASIRPVLSWSASPDAIRYTIEIATNPAFSPILETGTSTTNSFVPNTLLSTTTQYFWRVRQLNYCGESANSIVSTFTTGVPGTCPVGTTNNVVFADDMSGDATAWVAQHISGDITKLWAKTIPPAGTGLTTRAWFNGNSETNGAADQRLTSPAIVLPSTAQSPITLGFDAYHQFETDGAVNCWDGGFVEISTDGGATYEALSNSRTLTDAYPGVLTGGPGQGTEAWCRQAQAGVGVRSQFSLDQFAGQTVRIRFRVSADDNTAGAAPAGWGVDNIEVKGCQ